MKSTEWKEKVSMTSEPHGDGYNNFTVEIRVWKKKGLGRSSLYIDEVLHEAVDPATSTRDLARECGASKYTVCRHLHGLGKVKRNSRLLPYEHTPQQSAKFFLFLVTGLILAIMTDVSIDVSGSLSSPPNMDANGNNGLQRLVRSIPSIEEFVKTCKDSIRPWSLFANTNNFKLPPNFPRFLKRAVNNVKYFQGNYVVISLILMAYCLLASPYLLLLVIASLGGCYLLSLRNANRKLYIQGREVTLLQQYCLVGVISLPVYYWAGAGEALFWVLGASCIVISLHAGLYNIDAILNEQDQVNILIQQI